MDLGVVPPRDKTGAMVRQTKLPSRRCQSSQFIKTDTYPAWLAYARRSFSRNAPDQKAVLTFLSRSLNLLTGHISTLLNLFSNSEHITV